MVAVLDDARDAVVDVAEWIWLAVILLVAWEIASRVSGSLFVPPVSRIWESFVRTWFSSDPQTLFTSALFREHVFSSMGRFAVGYGWAAVLGIGAGVALGSWRPLGAFFGPLVRFGMSVPATALLPVAIAVFGVSSGMNIFLIALGSLWPILVNTYDGVRNIDSTTVVSARSLRLNRVRYFRSVVLPAASPAIFAGLRVSLGIALVLMVVSELYAATEGIGYYLAFNQRTFKLVDVWSATYLVALIGIGLNLVFSVVQSRTLAWHTGARASAEFAS